MLVLMLVLLRIGEGWYHVCVCAHARAMFVACARLVDCIQFDFFFFFGI